MTKKVYLVLKRSLDIFISLSALITLSPLFVFISLFIFLEDRKFPVVYSQKRVGKDRKLFTFYKFRSMVVNADEILFSNPKLYKVMRTGVNKMIDDPRVTKIGKFIRKYSLDELPQFINILKGDMSFVGPRAYRPDELQRYEKEKSNRVVYMNKILSIKPGLTGFWQVSGRSKIAFDQRIKMEAEYSQKNSILLDFLIIIKTPFAVLKAEGAY